VPEAVVGEPPLYSLRALDGGARLGKRRKESVAGVVDLLATVLFKERPQRRIMPGEEITPCLVTDRFEQLGRTADVSEHQRPGEAGGGHSTSPCEELLCTACVRFRPETQERRVG
jgi:hypothetical protein